MKIAPHTLHANEILPCYAPVARIAGLVLIDQVARRYRACDLRDARNLQRAARSAEPHLDAMPKDVTWHGSKEDPRPSPTRGIGGERRRREGSFAREGNAHSEGLTSPCSRGSVRVEHPDVAAIEQRGHRACVAHAGQSSLNHDSVEAREHAMNAVAVSVDQGLGIA